MEIALIIGCSLLIIGYFVFCFIAANSIVERATHPNYSTREQRQKRNIKHGFLIGTECYKREETTFEMSDGYIIHGDISINNKGKFIIFAHGHGSTREGAYKYTKIFYDLGYSLVMYDERGHGDNKRVPCTMGFAESRDLVEIVKIIKSRFGKNIKLGIFGYSMGGATTCLASRYLQDDVNFFVVDCAYSSLRAQCHNIAFTHFVPFFPTLIFANLMFKHRYNFSFKDCNAKGAVSINKLPICFFHGRKDKTVFPINSKILYNASSSKIKRLYYFENAGHSKSVESDRESYTQKIREFLKSIGEEHGN